MSRIILDFGSGNTCQNDNRIVTQMYDKMQNVDAGKHNVVVKWQLFKEAGKNIPIHKEVFDFAYRYGRRLGYPVTASVFDLDSLKFLLQYDTPFIKIANRPDLYWLIGEIPRKIPVYVSKSKIWVDCCCKNIAPENVVYLACVSQYPAKVEDYENIFHSDFLKFISDHTTDFTLWYKYQPEIIEWHYKMEDSTGLDAGYFARTPEQLREVL